ncbi:MAG: Crp/Fnr family transcriptional regulator [Gammaproteobacteria bacterium]
MNEELALYDAVCRYATLPAEEWRHLIERIKRNRFEPRAFLIRAGDMPGEFHFISKGLVQLSYPNSEGQAAVKSFAQELEMTGPLLAWLANEPSPIDIRAIEYTETVSLSAALLPDLLRRHPAWGKIISGYIEALARKMENRARSFVENTPERRYINFLMDESSLNNRLPLNQIAAYLGITDVSLSRIRRRLNNR